MAASYADIGAKLERAEAHIGNLERQIARFIKRKPYTVRKSIEMQDGKSVARLIAVQNRRVITTDISLVLLAGEAIYQLRSALDHLIHQLVTANGQAARLVNSRSHQFPIFETSGGYSARAAKMIEGVAPNVGAAIESEQPYMRFTYTPKNDPLWMLQDLNNTDKHRLIPVAVTAVNWIDLTDRRGHLGMVQVANGTLAHDKIIATIGNKEQRYDDVNPDLTCTVSFQDAMRLHDMTVGMDAILWQIFSRVEDLVSTLSSL